jgi:hypothetical protein
VAERKREGPELDGCLVQPLSESDPPNVEVFLNPTAEASTVTLDGSYLELDQSPVSGSLELPAYGGVALVIQ